jgi:hypothetical protein
MCIPSHWGVVVNRLLTVPAHRCCAVQRDGTLTMPKLSLRQAAQRASKCKSTILRAIQSGKISADRTCDGRYAIDPSEITQVYNDIAVQRVNAEPSEHSGKSTGPAVKQVRIYGLEAHWL